MNVSVVIPAYDAADKLEQMAREDRLHDASAACAALVQALASLQNALRTFA